MLTMSSPPPGDTNNSSSATATVDSAAPAEVTMTVNAGKEVKQNSDIVIPEEYKDSPFVKYMKIDTREDNEGPFSKAEFDKLVAKFQKMIDEDKNSEKIAELARICGIKTEDIFILNPRKRARHSLNISNGRKNHRKTSDKTEGGGDVTDKKKKKVGEETGGETASNKKKMTKEELEDYMERCVVLKEVDIDVGKHIVQIICTKSGGQNNQVIIEKVTYVIAAFLGESEDKKEKVVLFDIVDNKRVDIDFNMEAILQTFSKETGLEDKTPFEIFNIQGLAFEHVEHSPFWVKKMF